MFTGIIESLATITAIEKIENNKTFTLQSVLTPQFKIDQSISHNGVCLTVTTIQENTYTVTAIAETLQKTTLDFWQIGDTINIERAMLANARLDGHFVQGHVDATALCTIISKANGSWIFTFSYPNVFKNLIIEKGSICINGISLTCFDVVDNYFSLAIIPYTFEHTNISQLKINENVNIEFDIIGKYLQRHLQNSKQYLQP